MGGLVTHRPGDETWLRPGDIVRDGETRLRVETIDLVHEDPDELGKWVASVTVWNGTEWAPSEIKLNVRYGTVITHP